MQQNIVNDVRNTDRIGAGKTTTLTSIMGRTTEGRRRNFTDKVIFEVKSATSSY